MKKIIKVIIVLLTIVYLFLYFSYRSGYFPKRNEELSLLTEEKIKEYEEDLKNGVDVSKKSYIVVRDNYDNSYTRFLLRVSSRIEKGFDSTIKFIFNKISHTIND